VREMKESEQVFGSFENDEFEMNYAGNSGKRWERSREGSF
jgi:hypothetical protein